MAWLGTILAIFLLLTLGVSTGIISRVHQQTLITIFINIKHKKKNFTSYFEQLEPGSGVS